MIEISCNKTEKRKILEALEHMDTPCLFPRSATTCALRLDSSCRNCLEKKIKWNIH